MDELIFDIIADENAEMIQEINEIVNDAFRAALARRMASADVTIKIGVEIKSKTQADGTELLTPEFEVRTGYKLGGKYEGKKFRTTCQKGLWKNERGYWETRYADQQLSMTGG